MNRYDDPAYASVRSDLIALCDDVMNHDVRREPSVGLVACRNWPLTVRQEAGVPAVPPRFAVRGATRLRVTFAALSDRLGLPMQVLLERLLGVLDAPALGALVELDLPDRLDRPRTAAELAAETSSDAAALDRLLAYLASRGVCAATGAAATRPTG